MNRFFTMALMTAGLAASLIGFANADVISVNFGSDVGGAATAVGAEMGGVVSAGNWNDVPLAQQTNMALKDSSGATVAGLTLSTPETYTFPATVYDAGLFPNWTGFAQAGDTAMMRGHIYHAADAPATATLNVMFNGAIPYSKFDLFVYYNAGGLSATQTIRLLDGAGNSLGLSKPAFEAAGGDTALVESISGSDGNYVKFAGLTSADVPADFIVQAVGVTGVWSLAYLNGVQIAEVPEPSMVAPMLTALFGLLAYAWRKR